MRLGFSTTVRFGFSALTTLLLSASLPVTLSAREVKTYPEQGVQRFLGLDDTSAPTQVEDGRAQDIQNIILDISFGARQRYGVSLIGDILIDPELGQGVECAVTGIYYTKFSDGTERIVAACGQRFFYLDTNVWTTVAPTGTGGLITPGINNQFVFTIALDNIIGTNDVDVPIQWTGGTSDVLTNVEFTGLSNTIEKAHNVIFFKNYLIFGNTVENSTEHPTRFRWSNVGTINTWSDNDFIDIGALGGQQINCMAELYDTLIFGLTDSMYKVSLVGGDDVFQVSKITDDIGCIAKNSIQSITLENSLQGLVFLDKDKRVYFYNGVIVQDISGLITTVMGGLSGPRLQNAVSTDTGTDYILCVTNGTESENNLCFDMEYEIGEWTKHTNINANAMASVVDDNSVVQDYWGNSDGMVFDFSDVDLNNDVADVSGTVTGVNIAGSAFTSSTQVLYHGDLVMTNSAFAGAPILLTGGTGATQVGRIIDNTTTGLLVADPFSVTPDTTTTFEVGGIDSFYTSKWYDFKDAARLKHFGEAYFWGEADVSSTISVSYATDFNSDLETLSLSMSASSTDSIWGSAIWGVSIWGALDTIFRQAKLQAQGRYFRIKFAKDDLDEFFHLYGWLPVYWDGDVL